MSTPKAGKGERGDSFCNWRVSLSVLLIILGIVLNLLPFTWEDSYPLKWVELVHEVGKALIVAAILTWTVEYFLHKRFAKELMQDAFEATMGYLFPEEIRGEVRWIYNFPFLADQRDYTVTIKKLNDRYVEITFTDYAIVKNISNEARKIEV
jgi:hypothetical protein